MAHSFSRLLISTLPSVLSFVFITGCSEPKTHSSQVAAKVNGEEISIHQVNNLLSKLPALPEDKQEQARQQALEQLIDQKLYEQKAAEIKLDRSPEVVLTIEMVKSDVIANAYKQKYTTGMEPPSEEEAQTFVDENPLIFEKRKIFETQEILVEKGGLTLEQLQDKIQSLTMEKYQEWLSSQENVKLRSVETSRPSEQLPQSILVKLATFKDGESGVFETGSTFRIIKVLSSRSAPINRKTAIMQAKRLLAKQQAGDTLQQHLESLRAAAKIEYSNDSSLQ